MICEDWEPAAACSSTPRRLFGHTWTTFLFAVQLVSKPLYDM